MSAVHGNQRFAWCIITESADRKEKDDGRCNDPTLLAKGDVARSPGGGGDEMRTAACCATSNGSDCRNAAEHLTASDSRPNWLPLPLTAAAELLNNRARTTGARERDITIVELLQV